MKVFKSFILPHFTYGSETWNLTIVQQELMERAYSSCLRGILGLRVSDRHSLKHIRDTCNTKPLTVLLAQSRLRWLGHVARMQGDRYPNIALFAQLHGAKTSRGKPPQSFVKTVCGDLEAAGIPCEGGKWYEQARDKTNWRRLVRGVEFKTKPPVAPTRLQPSRAVKSTGR
jgi:hypothetical protein